MVFVHLACELNSVERSNISLREVNDITLQAHVMNAPENATVYEEKVGKWNKSVPKAFHSSC